MLDIRAPQNTHTFLRFRVFNYPNLQYVRAHKYDRYRLVHESPMSLSPSQPGLGCVLFLNNARSAAARWPSNIFRHVSRSEEGQNWIFMETEADFLHVSLRRAIPMLLADGRTWSPISFTPCHVAWALITITLRPPCAYFLRHACLAPCRKITTVEN